MTPKVRQQSQTETNEMKVRSSSTPESDQIAALAYELWQKRGCPDGSPEADWLRAEDELTTVR
jgi:hypothetical protein